MDSIAKYVNPVAALALDTSVAHAQSLFKAATDRHCLAVVDGGRPVGLLLRDVCLTTSDLDQTVAGLMDAAPLILDPATDALEACRSIAQRQVLGHHDGFLIGDADSCMGAASLRSLLDGLTNTRRTGSLAHSLAEAIEATAREELASAPFKRQFLDMIGQELRSPLDGVLAMTECLERQPLAADAQSQVRAIRDAGETLQRILAAAMDLTRAEHGLLPMAAMPLLLRTLVDEVQHVWMDRASRDGVTLLISFDGDNELGALTDGARLRQLFDCLIEAALRSTRGGSIEVGLKASVERDGVHIQGRVRDTGPGLTADKLARIFEPQPPSDMPLSEGGGGGLNLALARQIVLGLHGCIRAESNVGAGVSMIFDLLCEAAPLAVQDAPRMSAGAGGDGAAHILVVDDNATNRMVAEALCEMFDCTSECASDGVEAVEIAASGRFDVILMDIKMPRMDGMAATRAIRAMAGPAGRTPIIALTANVDPEDARAYLAAGMCSVVEKPIKPDRLLQAINEALAVGAPNQSAAA
jgi:CheY-like chemotaxis protein